MSDTLQNTPPAQLPTRVILDGQYVRLEPLAACHAADLYSQLAQPQQRRRFEFLAEEPPETLAKLEAWVEASLQRDDRLFSVVIDRRSGCAVGRQALMRITPEQGVIEIGSILWTDAMARTRLATEALFLVARHVFEDLGYRRFEWKCDARNLPSRRAALRFGFRFEGIFRQHMWIKRRNRDTAWFAMLDEQWLMVRREYQAWLQPTNFNDAGIQRQPLAITGNAVRAD